MPYSDIEKAREANSKNYYKNREKILSKNKMPDVALRKKNYAREYRQKRKLKDPSYAREYQRIRAREIRERNKLKVFKFYSKKEIPTCSNCSFDNIKALCIDHINDDGHKERKLNLYNPGSDFYYWIIRNNFPEGYQVLCYNCNRIKEFDRKIKTRIS